MIRNILIAVVTTIVGDLINRIIDRYTTGDEDGER